ncbi:MAG: hypothetical protein C4290_02770 [Chloroflexota bacterium]
MELQYIPAEERFYVRFTEEAAAQYPPGCFSPVTNYPVYAIRLRTNGPEDVTEFLIPASDGMFYWVDARRTRLARR